MNKEQLLKILTVGMISTLIILIFEIIFDLPFINDFFVSLITGNTGFIVWIFIWLIMFLQVTILNIPAYVILSACTAIGMNTLSWQYILCVLSAYMAGAILAYWLGRWFGKKAIKWCAGSEEDYNKWSDFINKKGKIWYFLTIILPIFPDDLLTIIAGSVKMNFGFYTIANLIGRGIGLITMLFVLKLIGNIGGGFPFMIIVWAVSLIAEFILYIILKKKKKTV